MERQRMTDGSPLLFTPRHLGKTVTKPLPLSRLGLPLSEKQIPQVVENLESGGKPKEALERVAMRPRQVRDLRFENTCFGCKRSNPTFDWLVLEEVGLQRLRAWPRGAKTQ